MRTAVAIVLCLIALNLRGEADSPHPPADHATACRPCHTVDRPTREAPSLAACARVVGKASHPVKSGPETITLAGATNLFGPVVFSHRAHAAMAQMGGHCGECHHESVEGKPIRPCGTCHSTSRLRTDLDRPDRAAAIHRQCLDCHLRWNPDTSCDTCHTGKTSVAEAPERKPRIDVPRPKEIVYPTPDKDRTVVTFTHADHIETLELACADCHKNLTCTDCHRRLPAGQTRRLPERPKPPKDADNAAKHTLCFACHADTKCADCHTPAAKKPSGQEQTGK